MKPKWLLSSLLLAGLAWPAAAQSTGTPVFVQPPQAQTPPAASEPLTMPSSIQYVPTPTQVTPNTQTQPAAQHTPTLPAESVQPVAPQPAPVQLTPTQPALPTEPKQQDLPGSSPSLTDSPFSVAQSPEKLVAWGGVRLSSTAWGLNLGASYAVTQLGPIKVLARGLAELGKTTGNSTLVALHADAFAEYTLNEQGRIYAGPSLTLGLGARELGLSAGYRRSLNSRLGAFVEGNLSRVWVTNAEARGGFGVRSGLTWRF